MLLLLGYDLNGREDPVRYRTVNEMVEAHSVSCTRPLYSTWFIETNDPVQTWHDRMRGVTDSNDRWFILPITPPRQGFLSASDVDWLRDRG